MKTIEFNPFKENTYKGVAYKEITDDEIVMSCTVTPEESLRPDFMRHCFRIVGNALRYSEPKKFSLVINVEVNNND